jgi:hypothetical protein
MQVLLTLSSFMFNLLGAVAMGAIGYAVFADRPEVQLPGRPAAGPLQGTLRY